jgi:dipeptidyl aminopeptidase/acylaminoacyl peptidase
MRKKGINLKVFFMIGVVLFILCPSIEPSSGDLGLGLSKKEFTIDDSLELEMMRFSSHYGISSDGSAVAYAVKERYLTHAKVDTRYHFVPRGFHVYVTFLAPKKTFPITCDQEYSWAPSWSPNGELLAFYLWRNDQICIGIWDRKSRNSEYYAIPDLTGKKTLDWSPQGDKLYYFPSSFKPVGPIWPYEKSEKIIIRKTWEKDSYEERFRGIRKSQLGVLDIHSKKHTSLIACETSFYSHSLSPDGKHIAVTILIRRPVIAHLVPSYIKLEIYPTNGGNPRTVLNDKIYTTPFSWSPDSRSIAYVDEEKLRIYDLDTDSTKSYGTEKIRITGNPVWHPDGNHILCSVGKDYYVYNKKRGEALLLKTGISQVKTESFWHPGGKALYIKAIDDQMGSQSIHKVDWRKGISEQILAGSWLLSQLALIKNRLFFTLQNQSTPENIWIFDLETQEKKPITEVNKKMADRTFGQSEIVHWKSLAGDPLKGVLIYPVGYVQAHKYPVVFWVYERFSHNLHRFFSHVYNLQILANQGYAVFMPDIKFTSGETARSFKDSVVPAMDKLESIGIANGNFGIMGRSFGGFATNIIITRTNRFKAAVTSCGITDWVSKNAMQGVFWRRGDQIGQGRLGGNLWEVRENYIKNSPVFHLDKVETPLLILHGTVDRNVHFSQAEEMYYGLRDLKKTAILVAYPGETHLGWDAEQWVHIDQWQRILAWFDKYLKD